MAKKSNGVPATSKFGTPEEIANRVGGTFRTKPENLPSNFRQLGGGAAGANPNSRTPTTKAGREKFGNPRRYA